MDSPSQDLQSPAHPNRAVDTAKEAASFTLLRYASNSLWLAGTAAGVYAERKFGVSPFVVCPVIGTGVAAIEYAGTEKAIQLFDQGENAETVPEQTAEKENRLGRIFREVGALSYAAWAGAMSAVKVNSTFGLESSKARRLTQSATYGLGVALWSSSLPGFKQAQDGAIEAGEYAINNPLESVAVTGVGSLAVYGILRAAQKVKTYRQNKSSSNSKQIR